MSGFVFAFFSNIFTPYKNWVLVSYFDFRWGHVNHNNFLRDNALVNAMDILPGANE